MNRWNILPFILTIETELFFNRQIQDGNAFRFANKSLSKINFAKTLSLRDVVGNKQLLITFESLCNKTRQPYNK